MTHISVPIKIVHTTKTAALNQPRFRKCTRERRACQFSPYFRGPPNCTMFTVGHIAGDLFRGSQLDSLSWCALCHLLYLSQCSHYLASHMEIKECFNVFQCHITFDIRSIWSIWFIHASFLSVPFNVWLDKCNQLRSMNHFQGMHLEKNECLPAIHMTWKQMDMHNHLPHLPQGILVPCADNEPLCTQSWILEEGHPTGLRS